jgi:hypothetical protein
MSAPRQVLGHVAGPELGSHRVVRRVARHDEEHGER